MAGQLHPSILAEINKLVSEYPESLVTMVNRAGEFQYVSPSAVNLVGFTPDETLGRLYEDFIHPRDLAHLRLAVEDTVQHGTGVSVTFHGLTKSGGYRPMHGFSVRLEEPDSGEIFLLARAEMLDES